jgi:hypothetical protein
LAVVTEPNQVEQLIAKFKESPAKSSAVTGLAVILVIAWVRLIVGGKTSPTPAQAASTHGPAAVKTAETDESASYEKPDSNSGLRDWAQRPVKPLARNPFAIALDNYPRDGAQADVQTVGNSYWDLVKKSMSARADQQEERQILMDNVRIAAGALKLQSTIMGAQPGAMLNGELVREGSVVAGFRVVKIEARQVIVEREGVKLALMMD